MNDKQLLNSLNKILKSVTNIYNYTQIKEIKDNLNNEIIVTKNIDNKTIIFIFDTNKVLKSVIKQNNINKSIKYDKKGIAIKNCKNLYLRSYKDLKYSLNY